jgi:hypothetical protein
VSKRQKIILAVIGVLLVLLFIVAVANPSGSGTGKPGERPGGLVGALGRLAGDAGAVPAADVTAKCKKADGTFVVAFGGCALTVAAGGSGLRTVRLRTDRALQVTAKAPRNDFTVTDSVDPGKDVKVAVDEKEATIGLLCTGGTCVVTLVGGS